MSAIPIGTYPKDPNATLDYTVDWKPWLDDIGDVASSFAWVVPGGITQVSTESNTSEATIWLSGGTEGVTYTIVCRITTVGGRIEDRSFTLIVVSR